MSDDGLLPRGTVLLDRYRIERSLGSGAVGCVYEARRTTIDKRVAVKVLSPEWINDPAVVVRFLQEAKAASSIEHENVVEVFDFGETEGGVPFFVMEFLKGESLRELIAREAPLPWSRVKPMLLQVLAGLRAIHAASVVHRDLKPDNCFHLIRIGTDDFIKILDFGIAKVIKPDKMLTLTREGTVLGTPDYMSPEQCRADGVDGRCDLYAATLIAYELLTKTLPHEPQASPVKTMLTKIKTPPRHIEEVLSDPLPPGIANILMRGLAQHPDERWSSAQVYAEAVLQGDRRDPEGSGDRWVERLGRLFRR